jgi:hypothetical protein
MKVMCRRIELTRCRWKIATDLGRMALGAQAVAGKNSLSAVRRVAVCAAHALAVHLALAKRSIDKDFVKLLAVSVIQAFGQQAGPEMIQARLSRHS